MNKNNHKVQWRDMEEILRKQASKQASLAAVSSPFPGLLRGPGI
jgi:uncharacterized protein involved in cysteine biosynthesis